MNTMSRPAFSVRVPLLWLALAGAQAGIGGHAAVAAEDAPLSWQSARMQAIEKEYDQIRRSYYTRTSGLVKPSHSMHPCFELLKERLSRQDLYDLAASCDMLPVRCSDRWGFSTDVLTFMVETFADLGDRDALVGLLSRRFVPTLYETESIEFYLAVRIPWSDAIRGNRLKDPMLILGEAYSRCETPEVRAEIADAVRRGFWGTEVHGDDDAEFVANAMQWYMEEKDYLAVNYRYWGNEIPLETLYYESKPEPLTASSSPRKQGGRWARHLARMTPGSWQQPLFEKTTAARPGKIKAILLVWSLQFGIAAVLSAPFVFFGRKRAQWRWWELLAFVLPFAVWLLLTDSSLSIGRKGYGNLNEIFYLALGVPLAAMVRVAIGPRPAVRAHVGWVAAALVGVLCVAAAAVFFLVPPILP